MFAVSNFNEAAYEVAVQCSAMAEPERCAQCNTLHKHVPKYDACAGHPKVVRFAHIEFFYEQWSRIFGARRGN